MVGEPAQVEVATAELRIPIAGLGSARYAVRCIGFSKRFTAPARRRELPSRNVTLMIGFGDPLRLLSDHDAGVRAVHSFVSGLQLESAVTERFGHQYGLHVQLSPLAAAALFGLPMHELTDVLVDLPSVLGADGARLAERLESTATWPARFALIRAELATRIAVGRSPSVAVALAWQELRAANGAVRIGQLVAESSMSHRHFIARFRAEVGVTPKQLARVLRFEHAVDLLARPGASVAETAASAGYYDQAHLGREFRILAGAPPVVLPAARRADGT